MGLQSRVQRKIISLPYQNSHIIVMIEHWTQKQQKKRQKKRGGRRGWREGGKEGQGRAGQGGRQWVSSSNFYWHLIPWPGCFSHPVNCTSKFISWLVLSWVKAFIVCPSGWSLFMRVYLYLQIGRHWTLGTDFFFHSLLIREYKLWRLSRHLLFTGCTYNVKEAETSMEQKVKNAN